MRLNAFSLAGLLCGAIACGGGHPENPVAPSALADSPGAVTLVIREPGNNPAPGILYPPDISTYDVSFPPRNEVLAFRLALEDLYRDSLRRQPTPTYVDAEGAVVWIQEYLRYRVNRCPHAEAVSRVLDQIDRIRTAAVCGSASVATFPARNEPYEFMLALEAHYQNTLRRPAGASYVDPLGNVTWTQEYLRYRTTGCPPSAAQLKVFDQIEGRGVPRDCRAGSGVTGVWDGYYQGGGGFVMWLEDTGRGIIGRYTGDTQNITDYPMSSEVSGRNYAFGMYFGDTALQIYAEWDGADIMVGTTSSRGHGNFRAYRRR